MGWGLIKALTCPGGGESGSQNCPEGRGGSDSMCVLGVEGSEKKVSPEDNFWNSPNDIPCQVYQDLQWRTEQQQKLRQW